MSLTAVIKAMVALGFTAEQIGAVVEKVDGERREKARAGNAKRQAEHRARHPKSNANNGVTSVTSNGHNGVTSATETGVSSRARVLPWEESKNIPPDEPNGSSTPKGVGCPKKEKRVRATRLPEDWQPKPAHLELAISMGMGRDRYARLIDEFRDYWKATPGARGTKLDWDATFRNRIREICQRERIVAPTTAALALTSSSKVWVARGSDQWIAWLKHLGKQSMPAIERNGEYGWNFESEWPPDATVTSPPRLPKLDEASASSCSASEREGQGRQATEARFAYSR